MRSFIICLGCCVYSLAALAQVEYCVESRGVPSSGAIEAIAVVSSAGGSREEALVAVSGELVIRSDDGGRSWRTVSSFDPAGDLPEPGMHAEDDSYNVTEAAREGRGPAVATFENVVAVVSGAQLLLSHDGGFHFLHHRLPLSELVSDVTFAADGDHLFVSYGAAIAVIALSTEGVHLVADVDVQADVLGLVSREGDLLILTGASGTEVLISTAELDFLPHRPPLHVGIPVRDLDVDERGGLWLLTDEGISRWQENESRPRVVASWPGLGIPVAMVRGEGEAAYVVDDGEIYVIDLGCRRDLMITSHPPTRPLRRNRRTGRRIVRGLLPVVTFDLEVGQGELGVVIQLIWSWPIADPWEQQRWLELRLDEDDELRRRYVGGATGLRVTEVLPAGDIELERAVRSLRVSEERALIEAMWP